ncbi:MAG TPA: IS1634 family transposase [Syntrophomonas sp.]|nr:IS1634 family transposase [Syntrophomonas sp.]
MQLGMLKLSKDEKKMLASALEARLSGRISLFEEDEKIFQAAEEAMQHYNFKTIQAREDTENSQQEQNFDRIDLNSVNSMQNRQLGPELVGHTFWERLGFKDILRSSGLSPYQISLAEAVVVGRLVKPGSDLKTWEWLRSNSALVELTDEALDNVGKNAVYEIADTLLEHKEYIESQLREKEALLFPEKTTLFLYDLTNTYLEGVSRKNELAMRGKSKEKRSDCPLITLALLVDSRGFPIFSQIYRGNQSEPETLGKVLERLESDSQGTLAQFMPAIVMDKGIATKDNIALLKSKEYPYVVVERRSAEKEFLEEFEAYQDTFKVIRETTSAGAVVRVYIKKMACEEGSKVLVVSEGRQAKEKAMDALQEERFLKDINKLETSIKKRNLLKTDAISRRVGRILERYPSIARYYDIQLAFDEKGKEVAGLNLSKKESREQRSTLTGCYVIETSYRDLEADEIWDLYNTLTQVEYAFRCLKTDLGMRPVHHHQADRTQGHLFISVLAYHLLICIENQLKDRDDSRKWESIKNALSSHCRTTIIMNNDQNQIHHIRVSGQKEAVHDDIYRKLNVKDPTKRIHRVLNK